MHYYTHNIGEFASLTRMMSLDEIGLTMILIDEYVRTEKPIAYETFAMYVESLADGERIATDSLTTRYEKRVLRRVFVETADGWVCPSLDEQLRKYEARAEINRENAKRPRKKADETKQPQGLVECDRSDSQSQASRKPIASESLTTKNQEPITNNQENNKKEEDACVCAGMGEEDNAFRLESPEADEKAQASKRKTPEAATHLFDLPDLPDDWREYCREVRPDLDPDRMFAEFKFYWQKGNGKGKLRSDKGWAQSWQNWIRSDKSKPAPATFVNRRPQTSSLPVPDCNEIDYHRGINPDGSF